MGKIVLKTDIPREQGFLYYVKGDPLELHKAKMSRGGKKKKSKKKKPTKK